MSRRLVARFSQRKRVGISDFVSVLGEVAFYVEPLESTGSS